MDEVALMERPVSRDALGTDMNEAMLEPCWGSAFRWSLRQAAPGSEPVLRAERRVGEQDTRLAAARLAGRPLKSGTPTSPQPCVLKFISMWPTGVLGFMNLEDAG